MLINCTGFLFSFLLSCFLCTIILSKYYFTIHSTLYDVFYYNTFGRYTLWPLKKKKQHENQFPTRYLWQTPEVQKKIWVRLNIRCILETYVGWSYTSYTPPPNGWCSNKIGHHVFTAIARKGSSIIFSFDVPLLHHFISLVFDKTFQIYILILILQRRAYFLLFCHLQS